MPGGGQYGPKGDVQKGWDNKPSNNNTNDDNSHFYAPPKKPKKKKRDASKKTIIEGAIGVVGNTILGTTAGELVSTAAYKHNLSRREKFIKKHGIKMSTMDPDYIGSDLGRKELDRVSKGDYKKSITAPEHLRAPDDDKVPGGTVESDTSILGSETKIQKDAVKKSPDGPAISEMAQLHETEAERLLKIKRKGRKSTKLLKDMENLTLSKKVLLG